MVDQQGNLLSKTDESDTGTGSNPNQLKYLQALEQSYTKRIEAIIAPIVGQENVRAQVAADVDFAHSEQMDEIYKPNQDPGSSTVRSQQTSESANWDRPGGRGAGRAFQPASRAGHGSDHDTAGLAPQSDAGDPAPRQPVTPPVQTDGTRQYTQGCHHQLRGGQEDPACAQDRWAA